MISLHPAQGCGGHVRVIGVTGVLHHNNPAAAFQRQKPQSAVTEAAGEDDANRPRAAADRGGAKHRIEGGARIVFPWAVAER